MADITKKRNNNRRNSGIKGIRPDMHEIKVSDASERLIAWQNLSPQEQLNVLDARLGKDIGAKKQRARIQKLLETK